MKKVTLTQEGQGTPFLIDAEEALGKNDYNFAYFIYDITADTRLVVDAYDQEGGRTTSNFLIQVQ